MAWKSNRYHMPSPPHCKILDIATFSEMNLVKIYLFKECCNVVSFVFTSCCRTQIYIFDIYKYFRNIFVYSAVSSYMYHRCGSNTMEYTVVLTPTVPSDTLSTVTHTITYSYILYKVNYRILSKISTVRLVLKTVVESAQDVRSFSVGYTQQIRRFLNIRKGSLCNTNAVKISS